MNSNFNLLQYLIFNSLGLVLLLPIFFSEGARAGDDVDITSQLGDGDYLQMLIWQKVAESHRFSGLAQYYNNIDYYLLDKGELIPLEEQATIVLEKGQWFVAIGRFKALVVQSDGLELHKSGSLFMIDNPVTLSESNFKVASKNELNKLSEELDIIRYHHLWFGFAQTAKGVEKILQFMHDVIWQNWGGVLFLFAILVKLTLLPVSMLTEKYQKQVGLIKAKLEPKLAEIKASFDGEEAHNLLMAAHKDQGVSPFYTLKPLIGPLIQIPILIGIFNALGEMQQFSGIPFLWVQDLAYPDSVGTLPFHIPFLGEHIGLLPTLMTLVTVISTIMFTNSHDSVGELRKQKRNLYLMALVFFLLFYPFPAVMVLYWTYSNVLHLLQQKVRKIYL
ncbi:MAG: YidC/Oxa1 family membrane protein insertase [Candidatus Azotimanducaceae bacterium]|jgi:YidC/Oxa1 family membrane protein insertase